MNHYVGLDVSVKETSLCIVDEAGTICRELKVTSHPDDLIEVLSNPSWHLVRIGLEDGPLSQWLFEGLTSICRTEHSDLDTTRTQDFTKRGISRFLRGSHLL